MAETMELGDIQGWDNTRKTVFSYAENNVFLGVPNITQNTLATIEPFIGGYGRVFCLQSPIFFDMKIRGLLMRTVERFCKGLSGISNYDLSTAEMTYGNNAETYTVPVGIKKGNNQFNLRFQELQGGIFRKILKYWGTGIADLGSGYGTYHGKTWGEENFRFSPVNHTAVILYALTDNSGGAYGLDSLEFACMWVGVWPSTIPNSHYEFTQGSHDPVELDVQFYGVYNETNTINSFAADMLKQSNFYRDNYNEFNLGRIVEDDYIGRSTYGDDTEEDVAGFEPVQADAQQYEETVTAAGLSPFENGTDGDRGN